MAELVDEITDDELDALEEVINKGVKADSKAVNLVDGLISKAPGLPKSVTVYKTFSDGDKLEGVNKLTIDGFLSGSTKKTAGGTVVSITVPAGTKALVLPDGGYVFKRGLTLNLKPSGKNFDASVKLQMDVRIFGMSPTTPGEWDQIAEFYNRNHDPKSGRFTSGKGGGGGGVRGTVAEDREKRLQEKEKRLQQQRKDAKKVERRRSRQQVIDTLLQITAVVASVGVIVNLLNQSGLIDLDQIGKNIQHKKNARDLKKKLQ